MTRNDGSLLGKPIHTYTPRGNKTYTPSDIHQFLKRFMLRDALRLIGKVSHDVSNAPQPHLIEGVPIHNGLLAYLTMKLIAAANDYKREVFEIKDLLRAADMYYGLPDPLEVDNDVGAYFLRSGAAQFDYDRQTQDFVARTLLIYDSCWDDSQPVKRADVEHALHEITDCGLRELITVCMAFTGGGRRGYVQAYSTGVGGNPNWVTEEKQTKALNWLSASYSDFRERLADFEPKTDDLDIYRPNPLWIFPIIKPDRSRPNGQHKPEVFLTPVPSLVYDRVTDGLHQALSEYFREDRGNPFRTSFGYAFQTYVGDLLTNALPKAKILSEIAYGKPLKNSVDWIVESEKGVVLVEVKQVGVHRTAKAWGDPVQLKRDLRTTLAKAVKQFAVFEQDVGSQKFPELSELDSTQVERLIITFDTLYMVNWTIKEKIADVLANDGATLPEGFHWQTIPVADFEVVVEACDGDLFSFLRQKRQDKLDEEMDFKEYIHKVAPAPELFQRSRLKLVYTEFMDHMRFKHGNS